ncbi:hypothetical protein [Symbioplanes lichenis]|uniref:hypothetical protein n=1 Tax=Symbioplanes lichenis TaxID=1629072 RepID=UPI00273A3F06|nr:hypothetical protein [Actinoplanes lichenis]
MRRKPLVLLGAAALVPLLLLGTTASASAASGTLTVTTYDRTGAKVGTPLKLINLATNGTWTATAGKAKSLPKGTYAVLAAIHTRKTASDTVGALVVKVAGKKAATIDARKGKVLKDSLDKKPVGGYSEVQAVVCLGAWSESVEVRNNPGQVFVIPNASKKLESHLATVWSDDREQWVVARSQKTIPATLTRTVKRSSLATLTSYVRAGVAGASNVNLMLQGSGMSCRSSLLTGLPSAGVPAMVKTHVSAGKWQIEADTSAPNGDTIGFQYAERTLAAGKSYSQTFLRSAWGPATRPQIAPKTIHFDTSQMFVDPGFGWTGRYGSEGGSKSTASLSRGGTLIKKQNRTDMYSYDNAIFSAPAKKKGWYLLRVDAQRARPGLTYPKNLLSARSSVWFSFYANPTGERTAAVAVPRFSVTGLDGSNRAKARTTTTVDIKAQGTAATTMSVKASYDGGKSWKAVPVKKSGGLWKATVKNQGAGFVALRAQAKTAKNYKTEVTVYRAYAVR